MEKQKLTVTIVTLVLLALLSPRASQTLEKPRVGFCVNLVNSPLAMYKRYQPLMDYLTKHTPYQFELVLSRNNREALQSFNKGKARLAWLDDLAFTEAHEKYRAIPILKPLNSDGEPIVRSVVIVPAKSSIRSIKDLRGKRVVFGPNHSATGNLFPRILLWRNGIELSDLLSYKNVRNSAEVIKAVLTGTGDAGAVVDTVADKYTHLGLRILARSEPFPSSPILARSDESEAFINAVSSALLALDRNNPQHEQQMNKWDPSLRYGFTRAQLTDYQQMIRTFKTWCLRKNLQPENWCLTCGG